MEEERGLSKQAGTIAKLNEMSKERERNCTHMNHLAASEKTA